jgi:hypothetical protein
MKSMEGFFTGLGTALVILAVCFGIGGCYKMAKSNDDSPLIKIDIHNK